MKKKVIVGLIVVAVIAGIAYANMGLSRTTGVEVTTEAIALHDLAAIVTASGKVEPKSSVDISAETMGKVVNLEVVEGQLVSRGQLLLQIDPRNLQTAVNNRMANLESSRLQLAQTEAQILNARVSHQQALDDLARQEGLRARGLVSQEQYDRSVNSAQIAETNVKIQEQSAETQKQRIKQAEADLESAEYDLNKVTVVSPIDGIVTRRNIEEGETAVVGTMNNAGTVLLTIADLSVIETEVEVDETDIPFVQIGQPVTVTIDAIPDREFVGMVTEVGNSPIQAAAGQRATNFKVVVTIEGAVPGVRPGFTCTAVITTATRAQAVGVPIQAMTVREFIVDDETGNIVRPEQPSEGRGTRRPAALTEPGPGQQRKELEGVFIVVDGRAEFRQVKIGIAGEKHFEVLSGLAEGDVVITGPFASVRGLREGDEVNPTTGPGAPPATTGGRGGRIVIGGGG